MGYKNSLAIINLTHFYFLLIIINAAYEIKGLTRVIVISFIK